MHGASHVLRIQSTRILQPDWGPVQKLCMVELADHFLPHPIIKGSERVGYARVTVIPVYLINADLTQKKYTFAGCMQCGSKLARSPV